MSVDALQTLNKSGDFLLLEESTRELVLLHAKRFPSVQYTVLRLLSGCGVFPVVLLLPSQILFWSSPYPCLGLHSNADSTAILTAVPASTDTTLTPWCSRIDDAP